MSITKVKPSVHSTWIPVMGRGEVSWDGLFWASCLALLLRVLRLAAPFFLALLLEEC